MVLTGGASRRMGRTKATLPAGSTTMSRRTAELVAAVADPVVEVGPGHSGLRSISDAVAAGGPLAAMATGATWLAGQGWAGPALVVATDLPLLTVELLRWLAAHPAGGSVVPLDREGRAQLLCARYHPKELAGAAVLVASGHRAMHDLLDVAAAVTFVTWGEWAEAGGPEALTDVDTPADLAALAHRRHR